jgi:hypothetical protein
MKQKAIDEINKKYAKNQEEMLSYAVLDKKRSEAAKPSARTISKLIAASIGTVKLRATYNPLKQGESKKQILKRLQKQIIRR